jgi:hypothetical protein
MRGVCGTIALALLTGCGQAYILLEVQSDLDIPSETDELHIISFADGAPESALLNVRAELEPGSSFPLDVALQPSGGTPETVLVFRVRALLEEREVATGEVRSDWDGGDLSLGVVLEPVP